MEAGGGVACGAEGGRKGAVRGGWGGGDVGECGVYAGGGVGGLEGWGGGGGCLIWEWQLGMGWVYSTTVMGLRRWLSCLYLVFIRYDGIWYML